MEQVIDSTVAAAASDASIGLYSQQLADFAKHAVSLETLLILIAVLLALILGVLLFKVFGDALR